MHLALLGLLGEAFAFATRKPFIAKRHCAATELSAQRRDVLLGGLVLGLLSAPSLASAKAASTFFYDEHIEEVFEPSQMRTDGRLDLNSAFVVRT